MGAVSLIELECQGINKAAGMGGGAVLHISDRHSITRLRTYTMMFLFHLLTDAVDIGNMVLSCSGELWRDGIAPAGGATIS